jgi:hypothetical protein
MGGEPIIDSPLRNHPERRLRARLENAAWHVDLHKYANPGGGGNALFCRIARVRPCAMRPSPLGVSPDWQLDSRRLVAIIA